MDNIADRSPTAVLDVLAAEDFANQPWVAMSDFGLSNSYLPCIERLERLIGEVEAKLNTSLIHTLKIADQKQPPWAALAAQKECVYINTYLLGHLERFTDDEFRGLLGHEITHRIRGDDTRVLGEILQGKILEKTKENKLDELMRQIREADDPGERRRRMDEANAYLATFEDQMQAHRAQRKANAHLAEFAADDGGAEVMENPEHYISALLKINQLNRELGFSEAQVNAESDIHPAMPDRISHSIDTTALLLVERQAAAMPCLKK